MAEGLIRHFYGTGYEAYSAGIEPSRINPFAIRVMSEIGTDISRQRSKSLEEFEDDMFDFVITVCDSARDSCPFFPHGKMIHRGFKDPSKTKGTEQEILRAFRLSRDEIKSWIIDFFRH
jgi:arsenate reductase